MLLVWPCYYRVESYKRDEIDVGEFGGVAQGRDAHQLDPVSMVVGLNQVLQVLSCWPGDVRVAKGRVVILGYFVYVVIPPLVHFQSRDVSLDMG